MANPTPEDHLLDRPVWHSLTGPHAWCAQGVDDARRFNPDIGPLAAPRAFDERGLAALAALVPADDALFTMEALPHPAPPAIAIKRHAALQMVAEGSIPAPSEDRDLLRLGPADASNMLALARLTEPGPFGMRTGELGPFWGIRDDGRLIAMEVTYAHYSGAIALYERIGFRARREITITVLRREAESRPS